MEILIKDKKPISKENIITFQTEYGIGKGLWVDRKSPEINQKYQVEFDISEELIWGMDIQKSSKKEFSMSIEGDYVLITGVVEKVWDDDVIDVRYGKSLIQLEVSGKKPLRGEYITIKTDSVEIYGINLNKEV